MISTAVILAARKEKDSDVPYPLLPFDEKEGECLLSRNISLLRQAGIKRIILIVGYRSELFDKYLDEDIIIVRNDNYKFTSSMASLAIASKYVKEDFLLIESDVLFERNILSNIISTSKKNCLTIVSESGSGDEAMVEIEDESVIKISKDLHQLNSIDGEMVGVSKLSIDALRKMMLRWENNKNPRLNYEYLFIDSTGKHEHGFIKFKDAIWCDVDNSNDFKRLKDKVYPKLRRKEDPFDIQNIHRHLKSIFPDFSEEEKCEVEYIGGMTNRNFKIGLRGKYYVLRIPGNGTEGMIERFNEGRNTILSNKMGISPEIRYINGETGIKLSDFITDAETLNGATIQRYDNLDKIANIFRTLHSSNVRMSNEFNVFHEILNYERLMAKSGAKMYEGYYEVRDKVLRLEDRLNEIGVEIHPCHNDLVPENFIKDPSGRMFLIDWEYSGMNDPIWDIAAMFIESDFREDSKEYFLRRYFNTDEIPKHINTKILIYSVLIDTLWSIWTVVKEKQGDDFGTYGIDRFNRAIYNLNKIREND